MKQQANKTINPKHWIVDEEAASVVRRVYDLTMQGLGSEQIASKFESEKILTPVEYWKSKGIKKPSNKKTNNPYAWNSATIITMLKTQEYCGDTAGTHLQGLIVRVS